jgi:hypothetical protein
MEAEAMGKLAHHLGVSQNGIEGVPQNHWSSKSNMTYFG